MVNFDPQKHHRRSNRLQGYDYCVGAYMVMPNHLHGILFIHETDLQNKTDYIEANPLLWDEDDENPINKNRREP